jgi:hypothetical protein
MSTCPRCNTTFECGMADAGSGPCWCTTLPALPVDALPGTNDARCLCPSCLRAWIAQKREEPDTVHGRQ